MTPDEIQVLDPFTTVWKGSHRRRSSKQTGHPDRFHLDPNCPLIGGKVNKGRLGSLLAHKWELCLKEARPLYCNRPTVDHVEEGRRRAQAALARGVPLGVNGPVKRTVHLG